MHIQMDRSTLPLVGAAGVGAALMYFLDPDRGARRRSLVGDQLIHARHKLGDGFGTTGRDLRNRARGAAAVARRRFSDNGADDRIVSERVRAELGRLVSHPSAITVSCDDGCVSLSGPVLAEEAGKLIGGVRSVRGVTDVLDRLERHESADRVPGLQGESRGPARSFELLQENWTPAARLLTGLAGGAVALYELAGERRRRPVNATLGVAGLALATRGAANRPLHRLLGIDGLNLRRGGC